MLFAGCAVGPNFRSPQVPLPEGFLAADSTIATSPDSLIVFDWWRSFSDPVLDTLIERAFRANRDLKVAFERITAAELQFKNARSDMMPSVGLDLTAKANYTHDTKIVQTYSVMPSISWEADIFGGLRRAKEAARADLIGTVYEANSVQLTLAANVAQYYFALLDYNIELSVSEETYRIRKQSFDLMDSMYYYGAIAEVDLNQARSLLLQTSISIENAKNGVVQAQRSLNVLLGENPTEILTEPDALYKLTPPTELPEILPLWVIRHRPDVMSAYYDVMQSNARIGVAVAQRFPSVVLNPAGGILYSIVDGATSSNPFTWSVTGNIAEKLLNFGKNKRAVDIARAENRITVLQYEQTVLTALSEIEQSLSAISTLTKRKAYYEELVRTTMLTNNMTNALYVNGAVNYLEVLDSERALFEAQLSYAGVIQQLMNSYVALFKAVGGGWE